MFSLTFIIFGGEDSDRELEDMKLANTGTSVAQAGCGCGVHGQCGHFGDAVPGRRGSVLVIISL